MVALDTDDVVITGLVTFLACFQMGRFAGSVGKARRRHKISPPATDGDPAFVRIFRAQQNCIEFFAMFLGVLWIASIFFNQYFASLAGLVYLYGRQSYFDGYYRDAKDRVPGFKLCVKALMALSAMATCGLTHSLTLVYMGFNIKDFVISITGIKF